MAYDSKSVKVPKSVKCVAATITNKHARGHFIRLHVKNLESDAYSRNARNRSSRDN